MSNFDQFKNVIVCVVQSSFLDGDFSKIASMITEMGGLVVLNVTPRVKYVIVRDIDISHDTIADDLIEKAQLHSIPLVKPDWIYNNFDKKKKKTAFNLYLHEKKNSNTNNDNDIDMKKKKKKESKDNGKKEEGEEEDDEEEEEEEKEEDKKEEEEGEEATEEGDEEMKDEPSAEEIKKKERFRREGSRP